MLLLTRNIFIFSCGFLFLVACSSRVATPPSSQDIPAALIQQHQQHIALLQEWQIRGRVAFIEQESNERQSATISWTKQLEHSFLRLSHPLRGTLAQLTQTPEQALLIDDKGKQYQARTLNELLREQFALPFPVQFIEAAITGKTPSHTSQQLAYYPDGTIASYQITLPAIQEVWSSSWQPVTTWHVRLGRYQKVSTKQGELLLPFEFEATQAQYQIKLQINQWNQVQ